MDRPLRVIPSLLIRGRGLWKTRQFRDPVYVGDPINAARIFNDKGAHELMVLDIGAVHGDPAPRELLVDIATECFMPACVGGGIATLDQIQQILGLGVEKVAINTAAVERPDFVEEAARRFGSSTIVASIDYRTGADGRPRAWTRGGTRATDREVVDLARELASRGAGELLLTSIDREGTGLGLDVDVLRSVAEAVNVPVIASGGAGELSHLADAANAGASAVGAGSMLVFCGRLRGVLITYPARADLAALTVR